HLPLPRQLRVRQTRHPATEAGAASQDAPFTFLLAAVMRRQLGSASASTQRPRLFRERGERAMRSACRFFDDVGGNVRKGPAHTRSEEGSSAASFHVRKTPALEN